METPLSTFKGVLILLAVLALGVAAAVARLGTDPEQLRAIALAAGVAGFGAVAGWIVARQGRGKAPGLAVAGGLGATVVRLFPVLIALGWTLSHADGPRQGRTDLLLVFFYLLLLATDVLLNMIGRPEPPLGRRGTTPN